MPTGISAVVLTKNEEKNIDRCLKSLVWCDEVIIVDDYSMDKTLQLAKRDKVRIFQRSLEGNFSQQRNFALSKTRCEWIFFVDADEEVSLSLQYEITHKIADQFNEYAGFTIKRTDEMWDKKILHGEAGNMHLLRLARRGSGEWKGKVHEIWEIKGKIAPLQNPLLHFPHQTVKDFLQDINFYSNMRAAELIDLKKKVKPWQIILYPIVKFTLNYFFRLGFLDGIAGLIVATMMSFHSFLVRGKVWLAYEGTKEKQ